LISEGLEKNSTINILNVRSNLFQKKNYSYMLQLAFNPLTTHGAQLIVQALNNEKSALSMLDISVRLIM